MDLAKLIQMLLAHQQSQQGQEQQIPPTTDDPDGWSRKMLPITSPEESGQSLENIMTNRSPGLMQQMFPQKAEGVGDQNKAYEDYKQQLLLQAIIRQHSMAKLKGLL